MGVNAFRKITRGFTLLELMVVIAVIAIGSAVASLALRDRGASALAREADRLAALLESARAQSRAAGRPGVVAGARYAAALSGAVSLKPRTAWCSACRAWLTIWPFQASVSV